MSKQKDCPGSTGEVLCAGEDDQPCMVFSRFKDGSPGRAWYATCATPEAARRVAACVGACAGVSTEILEAGARHAWGDLMADLEQQRDRLLAAVRTAAEQIRRCDYTPARSTLLQAIAAADAAIAACSQPEPPSGPF